MCVAMLSGMEIRHGGPVPVWKQVADDIARRIKAGEFHKDDAIPSQTAMRQEYGIAIMTARRVIRDLQERELVYTVTGRGSYVRG
ncbi:hypothetical protein Asera_24870 [Actinocatenispora sera]|uniref:HTH gntR-type domain-containing protein n=2 Tax=Actinocatenispora sera TaxID=390989 RepID=A0A810L0P3_9ACTN|nr:hypothetical protein Asera_24870 [Actinocatenispora sera]